MIAVAVGSSIDAKRSISKGLGLLHRLAPLEQVGPFWWTPAIGRPDDPPFLNGVVSVHTDLGPEALHYGLLRHVERACGRRRTRDRFAPRTLDLDLVLHHRTILDGPGLRLPDPAIRRRRFLACGLLALRPGLVLPGEQRPLTDPGGPPLRPGPAFDAEWMQEAKP